jgi:hypothetical protein
MPRTDRPYLMRSLSRMAVRKAKAKDELTQTVHTSQQILAKATTVFPLTLVPDTVTVDRTNVTIVHRLFYKMSTTVKIKIVDILNVTANTGPFFGSLRIVTTFVDNRSPYTINYLQREDALRINRILQGYKIAQQQEIDTSHLSKEELVRTLDRLSNDGTEAS